MSLTEVFINILPEADMFINILPEDVLVYIFTIHVWENSDTPHRLLRVCKQWHAVTVTTPSLWGDILLCDKLLRDESVPAYISTINPRALNNKIICRSVGSLVAAIERTGGSKFELTIVPHNPYWDPPIDGWDALQPSWFSERCRALTLVLGGTGYLLSQINTLPVLERLDIHRPPGSRAVALNSILVILAILEIAQRTSPRLHFLRAPVDNSPYFQKINDIYGRIISLHIWTVNYDAGPFDRIMKSATSVRTLGLITYHSGLLGVPLESPPSSVDTLILGEMPGHVITPALASNLLHLTVQGHFCFANSNFEVEFPKLTHLTYSRGWPKGLYLKAPRLKVLKLRSGDVVRPYDIKRNHRTSIRPEMLDLDVRRNEKDVAELIRDHWKTIKALKIIYIRRDRSLFYDLAKELAGNNGEEPLCPNLHKLVILSPKRSKDHQDVSERLLRRIREALKNNGTLQEVKYGWYDYKWDGGTEASADDACEYDIAWKDMMN